MATIINGLSERGRRELAHFLADNLKDKALITLLAGYENDLSIDGDSGHIEVSGFSSKSGTPAVRWFHGDELRTEEVDDEEA